MKTLRLGQGLRLGNLPKWALIYAAVVLWIASAAMAQQSAVVPTLVNFSGTLTDVNRKPLTGVQGVTFLLYKDEQGGAPLWMETQNVFPDKNGRYTVQLGATTSQGLPSEVFASGEARWLAVQVAGQSEQPRVSLLSVPYALKAADAQTVGGLPASAFMLAIPSNGSAGSAARNLNTAGSSAAPPPASSNVTTTGGAVNALPLFTTATNIQNSILTQTGTTTINVAGKLNSPATGTATAAKGFNSQPQDLVASVFNSTTNTPVSQTFQWQAEPINNDKSTASGTLNLLYASGTGIPAETGLKISNKGLLTFAAGQTFAGAGTITGVKAGTDLTGGGATGNVTLNLDTTKVPLLSGTNTFVGNQTITGNLSDTGNISATGSISGQTANFIGNDSTQVVSVAQNGSGAALVALGTGAAAAIQGKTTNGFGVGVLGSSTATSGAPVAVQGVAAAGFAVSGINSATSGFNPGVIGTSASSSGPAVAGENTSTTGSAEGVFGSSSSPNGVGVAGLVPGRFAIALQGNALGGIGIGVLGNSAGTLGTGVLGTASSTTGLTVGVFGQSSSAIGTGVLGENVSTTGSAVAVNGISGSTTGIGVLGQTPDLSNTGRSIMGSFPTGVWGDASPSSAAGLVGTADDSVALVLGNNSATKPTISAFNDGGSPGNEVLELGTGGVFGEVIAGDPACGFPFIGIQLGQRGMSNCNNYTLIGDNSGNTYLNASANGFISFRINNGSGMQLNPDTSVTIGTLNVTNTLTKPAGSFKIDHPLDPANKYLYHSFVESPDMKNIYDGIAVLDEHGEAVVILPDWFGALNREFRYQLTNIGGFAPVYIAEEIENNRFKIAGGRPGIKVSWQVTGIRQDAFANAHRIEVEVEKAEADRRHYLHPELFGAPETARIGYVSPMSEFKPKYSREELEQHRKRFLGPGQNTMHSPQPGRKATSAAASPGKMTAPSAIPAMGRP